MTALEPDPRRPGAVRIRAGEALWTVAAADAEALGIRPGQALDDNHLAALEAAADAEAALRTALRALGRRAFARADLGRRLVARGHPAVAVEKALARCAALGLLDDAAFARQFVESRSERGRGPARLRRDLSAMGVARETADAAIGALWADGDATAGRALELARQRAGRLEGLPRATRRRRLLAFLARRGFTGDAARKAVLQVVG